MEKLGLTLQPKSPDQAAASSKIIKADLSAEEFHREWRKVSLPLRALFFVLAPLIGLQRRLFATRESLGGQMSLEDRKSADELLNWTARMEPFHHSILHARDNRLLECLVTELEAKEGKRVAVVYGARHIRSVVRELNRRGFHCEQASWQTVLSF